jgi:hypothetical protein
MSLKKFIQSCKLAASESFAAGMGRCPVRVGSRVCGRFAVVPSEHYGLMVCQSHARLAVHASDEYVYSDIEDDETEEIAHA